MHPRDEHARDEQDAHRQGPDPDGGARRMVQMVWTIGPACRSPEMLRRLFLAGMDVARLHFAYAGHEEHEENMARLRSVAHALERPILILQDLSGSKVRMQGFAQERVTLETGSRFTLTSRPVRGDTTAVRISIPELIDVVRPQDRVLLNDGALQLLALEVSGADIHCEVTRGGTIKSQQAVHVPGRTPQVRVPTRKDREDIAFGLRHGVDWVALSYARTADEVEELRDWIRRQDADKPILVKIERKEALDDLDAICRAADGIMVARGDLGLEVPLEEIGVIQKDIVQRSRALGKPVVVATEMMASMLEHPEPTRAEVTDITNAVLDGATGVMLSGETAIGPYPIEAARMMTRIVDAAERHGQRDTRATHDRGGQTA